MIAIRKHARDFAAIVALVLVAAVVAGYILREQGFRFPFLDPDPFRIKVELATAQAVTAGQGQTVQVSGVVIGRIGAVHLEDGRGIVELEIEPRHRDLVRTDAKALLRPRTGLKDMYIQMDPGTEGEPAPEGFTIPVANTLPDVNLDEILASLDADTRAYVQLLVNGAGRGLRGRGRDLAEVFRRLGPTYRDLRRVNREVGRERVALRRLITSLARLNRELASRDDDLSELVSTSARTFRAFASEEGNLSASVRELGPTLRQATTTLGHVRTFANQLRPTATALVPAARALPGANRAVRPAAREIAPILAGSVRPFVRESRPLVRDLRPAARDLADTTPDLRRSFAVLNRLFNMLAFNRDGREPPGKSGRDEGYLFWIAWVTHQTANLINIDDANGPLRPVFLTGTCSTLAALLENELGPQAEFALNLSPLLATVCGDPQTDSIDILKARRAAAAAKRGDG